MGAKRRLLLYFLPALILLGCLGLLWKSGTRMLSVNPFDDSVVPPSEIELKKAIDSGNRVVIGVNRFKREIGLWPISLEEVCPAYVDSATCSGWVYVWNANGDWKLLCQRFGPLPALVFQNSPDARGWRIPNEFLGTPLNVPVPDADIAAADNEQRQTATLKCFRQRIHKEPNAEIHRQAFVLWLWDHQRHKEAIEGTDKCIERWPSDWWPRVVRALIENDLGRETEGERQLVEFVENNTSFGKLVCLAIYYSKIHHSEKLEQTLVRCRKVPIAGFDEDTNPNGTDSSPSADFLAWQLILYAYHLGKDELTISLCDHWEKYGVKALSFTYPSCYAVRAACLLRRGRFDDAQNDIRRLDDVSLSSLWAQNVDKLIAAVRARDKQFRYDPGTSPRLIDIWVDYQ
jgi:hypothetical protein